MVDASNVPGIIHPIVALLIVFATAVVLFRIISHIAPRPLKFYEMVLLSGLIVFPFIWFPAQFVNIGFKVVTLYTGFYVGTFIVQAIRKARN
jgi:hypothetical protein|tara:strand:- start:485 stop:760 length:276 start_codon:yes stop_codon:yes gene_type:complete